MITRSSLFILVSFPLFHKFFWHERSLPCLKRKKKLKNLKNPKKWKRLSSPRYPERSCNSHTDFYPRPLHTLCSYHLGDKICLSYLSTIPNPPSRISACKTTAPGRSNTVWWSHTSSADRQNSLTSPKMTDKHLRAKRPLECRRGG